MKKDPEKWQKSKCFSIGLNKERQLWKSNCTMWGGEEGWEFCWKRSVPPLILHSLPMTITMSFSFQEREDIFHWGMERGQLGGEGTERRGYGVGNSGRGMDMPSPASRKKKGKSQHALSSCTYCFAVWWGVGGLFVFATRVFLVLFCFLMSVAQNNILVYFTS